MKDLFFALYGNGLEWIICCLLMLLIGIILLTVALTKLKKTAKIINIIIAIILMWQIVPCAFMIIAVSQLNVSFSQIGKNYQTNINTNNNYKRYIKYLQMAANTAVIPLQKAIYYCGMGEAMGSAKNGKAAIEYYDKAYKYTKSYSYRNFAIAALTYDAAGDYETCLKIYKALELYRAAAGTYILAYNDYDSAMEYINKDIELKPQNPYNYAMRAYINYKLNKRAEEYQDYKKALEFAKTPAQKQYVSEYKNIVNKEIARHKLAAKNFGFTGE